MGINNIIEEKALASTHKIIDSFEEKVSAFLLEDFHPSDPSFDDHDHQDDDNDDQDHLQNSSIERILFWESQEALLQEILERNNLTGPKLRQEISKIIEKTKEKEFCKCHKPNSHGCNNCLRQFVVHLLCQRGFKASLCTSKWKGTHNFPGGKHEYIEVIVSTSGRKKQIPFVIEMEFKEQFEIAKACENYKKFISQLPKYYIGKAEYLNAIVGVLCESAKRSMNEKKIHMGPWRKKSFMQMKWSSSSLKSSIDESSKQVLDSVLHFSAAPAVICT